MRIGYGTIESPVGPLVAGATDRGLVQLAFLPPNGVTQAVASFATRLGSALRADAVSAPDAVEPVANELREYFAGARRAFGVPLDRRLAHGFVAEVLARVEAVPFGEVTTYGTIARELGVPAAARSVGAAVGSNPIAVVVPCHRVVGSTGSLVGYGGGLDRKRALLALEGALERDDSDPLRARARLAARAADAEQVSLLA